MEIKIQVYFPTNYLVSSFDKIGSLPFSGVSPQIPGVLLSFTSLFRRASLFPSVTQKLLIILVFTKFSLNSSRFHDVLYLNHQIPFKLPPVIFEASHSFFALSDASIVVPNFQC